MSSLATPAPHQAAATKPCVLCVATPSGDKVKYQNSFAHEYRLTQVASPKAALTCLSRQPVVLLVVHLSDKSEGMEAFLRRVLTDHSAVTVVLATPPRLQTCAIALVQAGLAARYLPLPWVHDAVANMLAWGTQAFAAGQPKQAVQQPLCHNERLTHLGQLSAAMMHDLRQPISYMVHNVERLKYFSQHMPMLAQILADTRNRPNKAPLQDMSQELSAIVNDMATGCELLLGLANQMRHLLTAGAQATGHARPAAEHTDPLPVIRYALKVCQPLAAQSQATMTYRGPCRLPSVRIGRNELTQVLINLLANAAQAHAKSAAGGKIMLTVKTHATELHFAVLDNGPGMHAQILQQLGRPFFTTHAEGTGIGLAQCKRILAEHGGGALRVASKVGMGSRFSFTLKQSQAAFVPAAPQRRPSNRAAGRLAF